jgi:hypothetical protein
LRRRQRLGLWPALFLVAMLVGARAATLVHETDIAAHSPADSCEFCLHASPIGHAMVDAGTVPLSVVAEPARAAAPAVTVPRRAPLSSVPRGPPFSLYC